MIEKARELLKQVFGYDDFRPLQEECIQEALAKRDTLLIMPTGGGKSLCYQIPALIFDGLTVVVSPLISLMTDQVNQLKALGVECALLNSSLKAGEYRRNFELVEQGKAKVLFLAPETLMKEHILNFLSEIVKVDCFTIDEAHCISEWGHDFRPEYRKLAQVRERFSGAVCLAMTATATPRVQQDIQDSLHIQGKVLKASFNRENLFYEVVSKTSALKQTEEIIERFSNQSGIIYCFSRKQVDTLSKKLADKGLSVKPYHAGLSDEERAKNQDLFIRDDVQIIVATIAFGMGINKPNVRFVVHYDLPRNPEAYYQETGRAGRDGLPSHCLLLFSYADIYKIRYLIDQKMDMTERKVAGLHLNAIVNFAESKMCRRKPLITYFGEDYDIENCGLCDNCTNPKEEAQDLTEVAQKFLSCMFRTGERFGANHLIDILRGSQSKKVKQFSHDQLSTYGIGKELSANQWKEVVRQWIHQGVIKKNDDIYGVLRLTEKAWEIIKGDGTAEGHLPVAKEDKPRAESKQQKEKVEYDRRLFKQLRELRKQLADRKNVPPYVIFPDKTLIEIAVSYPQTKDSFSQIFGVGQKKLESYGDTFLKLVQEYCEEEQIDLGVKS